MTVYSQPPSESAKYRRPGVQVLRVVAALILPSTRPPYTAPTLPCQACTRWGETGRRYNTWAAGLQPVCT